MSTEQSLPLSTTSPKKEVDESIDEINMAVLESGNRSIFQEYKKLIDLQIQFLSFYSSVEVHKEASHITCSFELGFCLQTLQKALPLVSDELNRVTPLWIRGQVPTLGPSTEPPSRFKDLSDQSFFTLLKTCCQRDKTTRYQGKRKKICFSDRPIPLSENEYVYLAGVLAVKSQEDQTISVQTGFEKDYALPLAFVLSYFFGLGAHPQSDLAETKKRKLPKWPTKSLYPADILTLFEDLADQTIEAAADIDDPRHHSARKLTSTLISINKKHFYDLLAMYLSVKDIVEKKLNLCDYLKQLLEASEITNDQWYFDLAKHIVDSLSRQDLIYSFTRLLTLKEVDSFLTPSSWPASLNMPHSLAETLTAWSDGRLPLVYSADTNWLMRFNKHIGPKHNLHKLELSIDEAHSVIAVDISLTPTVQPDPKVPPPLIKTSFRIDYSRPNQPAVDVDVIDSYDIEPLLEQNLINLSLQIMSEAIKETQQTNIQPPLSASIPFPPTNTVKSLRQVEIKPTKTTQQGPKRKRRPKPPTVEPEPMIKESAQNARTWPIMTIKPSVALPPGITRQAIEQKVNNYNSTGSGAIILKQKLKGRKVMRMRIGNYRILAELNNGGATVFMVSPRRDVPNMFRKS